jgi:hypothetical protein
MRTSRFAAFLAACLLSGGAAHAIAPGLGELKAISSGVQVPPGAAVAVLPDVSDALVGTAPAYVAARGAAVDALRGLGFRPEDGAPMTLRIEVTTPHFNTHRNGDDAANAAISTDTAQQLGPGRKTRVVNQVELPFEGQESGAQPGLSLALFLLDERNRPMWSATFQAGGRVHDAEAMIRRMTRAAVASLGVQVQRTYVLACEKENNLPEGTECLP